MFKTPNAEVVIGSEQLHNNVQVNHSSMTERAFGGMVGYTLIRRSLKITIALTASLTIAKIAKWYRTFRLCLVHSICPRALSAEILYIKSDLLYIKPDILYIKPAILYIKNSYACTRIPNAGSTLTASQYRKHCGPLNVKLVWLFGLQRDMTNAELAQRWSYMVNNIVSINKYWQYYFCVWLILIDWLLIEYWWWSRFWFSNISIFFKIYIQ